MQVARLNGKHLFRLIIIIIIIGWVCTRPDTLSANIMQIQKDGSTNIGYYKYLDSLH